MKNIPFRSERVRGGNNKISVVCRLGNEKSLKRRKINETEAG